MLLSVIVTVFISLKVDDLLLSLERRCCIMALKNLSHFTEFNAPLFLAQKELRYKVDRKKWDWFRNEKNNIGEQLTVKVPLGSMTDYGTFQPMLTSVEIVDIEKAIVYREYRNQLSLTAKVIEVVEL